MCLCLCDLIECGWVGGIEMGRSWVALGVGLGGALG